MIRLGFAIRSDSPIPSGRRFAAIRKAVHKAMAEAWTRMFLPGHFQAGAAQKYGYKTRSKGTRRRKLRKGGLPYLVEEGELRESALATAPYGLKAMPNYIKLSLSAPFYITQQQRPKLPDYPAEVFATRPSEEKQLTAIGEARATDLLRQKAETKTVTIT